MLDGIDEEKILDAIRKGVCDAMWRMITNATAMPGGDFFEMVKQGVEDGIDGAMPLRSDIKEAITEGIVKAMPYSSEIADAVYQATKE